jgi:hypothetical protein
MARSAWPWSSKAKIGRRAGFNGLLLLIPRDGAFPTWQMLEIFEIDLLYRNLCAAEPA